MAYACQSLFTHQILNHRQPKLKKKIIIFIRKPVPQKIFENNYLEFTLKEYFFSQLVDFLVISVMLETELSFPGGGSCPLCPRAMYGPEPLLKNLNIVFIWLKPFAPFYTFYVLKHRFLCIFVSPRYYRLMIDASIFESMVFHQTHTLEFLQRCVFTLPHYKRNVVHSSHLKLFSKDFFCNKRFRSVYL